ncbi:hypothetical protein E3T61_15040 [Cryobacterium lactosi]|uniref:Uncharacterized protein n=1 Tax=Cryobacterium lactosi TaxID=1259202 RepID=A0A4R9BMY5_9MICO|nr:hypothetical protein [Cryobacterium lactosi]TFD87154.1 hypothetical protein E3T61_15040 [Cryobacterium lactosi]
MEQPPAAAEVMPPMPFGTAIGTAIGTAFRKFATFDGRATRAGIIVLVMRWCEPTWPDGVTK